MSSYEFLINVVIKMTCYHKSCIYRVLPMTCYAVNVFIEVLWDSEEKFSFEGLKAALLLHILN